MAHMLHMPHEVCAGIVWSLGVEDTARLAPTCKMFGQETTDAELWFQLFLRTCWPPSGALLAFAEGTTTPVGIDWRARMQVRMESTPTIVVDMGRGYTKYTVVHGVRGRWELDGEAPQLVQLCSSPTHPPDCDRNEQLSYIHHRLDRTFLEAATDPKHRLHTAALGPKSDLKVGQYAVYRGEASEGRDGTLVLVKVLAQQEDLWTVEPVKQRGVSLQLTSAVLTPMRRAHDLPILIGEPFIVTAQRNQETGPTWDRNIRCQLGNNRPGAVQVVSQAQMALWAHGVDHGIVVNIGQSQTIALPVVRGEVIPSCSTCCNVGSADLTQVMVSLMHRKAPSLDGTLMTWCRDLKEAYCYVSPPAAGRQSMRARLAAGDDFGIRPIPVELPSYAGVQDGPGTFELAEERVLVPEVLFEANRGGPSVPQIIVQCANMVNATGKYTQEDIRDLLRQVVLVGGAADFPGIRPRVEYEMRSLLQQPEFQKLSSCCESTDDVYVLNPPLDHSSNTLVSPRFVPLFGGCVRAASSAGYGALERDKNTGALRTLPLQEEDLNREEAVGLRRGFFLQRRMLALQLPNIFRTGGGGGEDDQVWQELFDDSDEEMEAEDESAGSICSDMSSPIPQSPNGAAASSSSPERAPERADRSRCNTKGGGKGKGKRKGSSSSGRPRRVWRPVRIENDNVTE